MKHYLVIGNSAAALHAVEGIRGIDREGVITLVTDEEVRNYSRPLLSYYLGGRIGEDQLSFRDQDFYQRHKIELLLGKRAVRLNTQGREVTLADGEVLSYDRLLLATGGKPIIPTIDGLAEGTEGIFTFTRLAEVKRLISYIEAQGIAEGVVLGGGLIGIKAVEGLIERGLRVTIIELMDHLLPNNLDKEASVIIAERLAAAGCRVITRDTIAQVKSKRGGLTAVVLKGGEQIPTQLLILAIGVAPNLDLVKGTPIATDRGILVAASMQTNVPEVYAAGDCSQGLNVVTRKEMVIPIWPVAAKQGKVAGVNMAGGTAAYQGLFPMNAVQLLDTPAISFGLTNPPDGAGYEVIKRVDRQRGYYRKVVLKDDRVVGAILIGEVERGGIYGMLIREGIDVKGFKDQLASDHFGLLILPQDFRKHLVSGEGFIA